MKIGIYAGAFDPIHAGHIAFAKAALEQEGLERIVFVPEKEPYRKQPLAAWTHRQAMLETALEHTAQLEHDTEFAKKLTAQHTLLDMLQVMQAHYNVQTEVWFLAGSDVLEHLHDWHDIADSGQYGGFLISLRAEHTENWVQQQLERSNYKINIKLVPNSLPTASSTLARNQLQQANSEELISPVVRAYIQHHQLYL